MNGINLRDVPSPIDFGTSSFDRSFFRLFDHKFGDLIPVMMLPVSPHEDFSCSYQFLNRMAPFISQVFQEYKVTFDFYFVPNQLVWKNFELFMSAGYDGKSSYVHPYFAPLTLKNFFDPSTLDFTHTILDYLDIPPAFFGCSDSVLTAHVLNALPWAAYIQAVIDHHLCADTPLNKVLETIMSREYILADGDQTANVLNIYGKLSNNDPDWTIPVQAQNVAGVLQPLKHLYPLDYFTSCRSNPQLGPVMTIPVQLINTDSTGASTFKFVNNAASSRDATVGAKITANSKTLEVGVLNNDQTLSNNRIVVNGSVLSNVATINDFYSAARIQELLTLYGYSGFTPSERISAEFGVKNPDSRMHKAEWLHSSIHDVSIGEVFSNNVNNATVESGLADIPGSGTAVSSTNSYDAGFHSFFSQYGFVVGLMSVLPEASYCQGIPRHYFIKDRFEYPHSLLSQIGMASVYQREIMADPSNENTLDAVFGYMSQYGDSKVSINRCNGELRDDLKYMHAGRIFPTDQSRAYIPSYNDSFCKVYPGYNTLNRTFNYIGSYYHDCPLLTKVKFNVSSKQKLPYYGLPRF